jgi:hypothetical protein
MVTAGGPMSVDGSNAAAMVEAAEGKAAQAEADLAAKRVPYEQDPIFMYLWRRGFGTSRYTSKGIVRSLDRMVARHVGYAEASRNYALLTELPIRLREHAERLRGRAAGETCKG